MALDLTKKYKNWQKKSISVAASRINSDQGLDGSNTIIELANLPANATIVNCYCDVLTATATASVTAAIKAGSTTLLSAAIDSTGVKSGTTRKNTGTGLALTVELSSAVTDADFIVEVVYIEYNKTTGELTEI